MEFNHSNVRMGKGKRWFRKRQNEDDDDNYEEEIECLKYEMNQLFTRLFQVSCKSTQLDSMYDVCALYTFATYFPIIEMLL